MKKSILFTLAALAIIFTQCKKAENVVPQGGTTQSGKTIEISLKVNNNSKVIVNPGTDVASVYFMTGDVIHVASDGKYSGTLTCNGGIFKGEIVAPSKGSTMYFYFLGNKSVTDADGKVLSTTIGSESTSFMVNISDQSTELPVISYGTATYNETTTEYSATLRNQCGLVKFNVSGYSGSGNVIVTGMNNKVEITDLSNPTFNYGKMTNKGDVKLYKQTSKEGEVEYWAILLPQNSYTSTVLGVAHTADGYLSTNVTVPEIAANVYNTSDATITLSTPENCYVDLGLSVKWAICNVGATASEGYGDYYAWGEIEPYFSNGTWNTNMTTGAGNKVNANIGYAAQTYNQGGTTSWNGDWTNKPYNTSTNVLNPDRDAATVNWGGSWRMPTADECTELRDNCTWEELNAGSTSVYDKSFTAAANGFLVIKGRGSNLVSTVHIFLPTAGWRYRTGLSYAGEDGFYWSSTVWTDDNYIYARRMFINKYDVSTGIYARYYGHTVRPVW